MDQIKHIETVGDFLKELQMSRAFLSSAAIHLSALPQDAPMPRLEFPHPDYDLFSYSLRAAAVLFDLAAGKVRNVIHG